MVSSAKSLLWSDHNHRVKCYLPMSSLCSAPCSVDGKKVFLETNIKGSYRSDMLYEKRNDLRHNKSETIDISSSFFCVFRSVFLLIFYVVDKKKAFMKVI